LLENSCVPGDFDQGGADVVFVLDLQIGDVDLDIGLQGLKLTGGRFHRFAQFGNASGQLAGGGGELDGAFVEGLDAPDDLFHGGMDVAFFYDGLTNFTNLLNLCGDVIL
jgi:hypothetical protein